MVNDICVEVHGRKPIIEPELLNGTTIIEFQYGNPTLNISEDGGWTLLTWNCFDYYKKKATCAIIIIWQSYKTDSPGLLTPSKITPAKEKR